MMRSSILRSAIAVLALAFIIMPWVAVYSADEPGTPMVPCGYDGARKTNPTPGVFEPCESCAFYDFVGMIQGIVNGTIFMVSVYAAISFMYAGYAYLTSNGSQEKVKYAKQIFYKVLIGYIVVLTAWLMIYMVEQSFLSDGQKSSSFLYTGEPEGAVFDPCSNATTLPSEPPPPPVTGVPRGFPSLPAEEYSNLPPVGYFADPNCNGTCSTFSPPRKCVASNLSNPSGGFFYTCLQAPNGYYFDSNCGGNCSLTQTCTADTLGGVGQVFWCKDNPPEPPKLCPCPVPPPQPPPPPPPPVDTTVYYPEPFNKANCTVYNATSMYSPNSAVGYRLDPNISIVKSIKLPIYKFDFADPFSFSNTVKIIGANGPVPLDGKTLGSSAPVVLSSSQIPNIAYSSPSEPLWAVYTFSNAVSLQGYSDYYIVFSAPSIGYQSGQTDLVAICGATVVGNIYYTDPFDNSRLIKDYANNHVAYYGLSGVNEPLVVQQTTPVPVTNVTSGPVAMCPCTDTPPIPPPSQSPPPQVNETGMFPQDFNVSNCTVYNSTSMYSPNANAGYLIDPSIRGISTIKLPVYRLESDKGFDFSNRLIIAGSNSVSAPYNLKTLGVSSNTVHLTNALVPKVTFSLPSNPFWALYGFSSVINLSGYDKYFFLFEAPSSGYISGATDMLTLCGSSLTYSIYYTDPGNPNVFKFEYPNNHTTYYEVGGPTSVSPPADTTAPSTPSITATPTSCTLASLSWTSSTDNSGGSGLKAYKIYRNGVFLKEVSAGTLSTTDTVSPSTTYSYAVSAVDVAGNESTKSSADSATTPSCPDTNDPTVPQNLSATGVSTSQISLSWDYSTDNIGVTGYKIYQNGVYVTSATTNAFIVNGLNSATNYCFEVSAFDGAGNESAKSASKCAVTQSAYVPPPPPVANVDLKLDGSDGPVTKALGTSGTFSWWSTGVVSCSSNFGGSGIGSGSLSYTFSSVGSYSFSFSCTTSDGVTVSNFVPVTVN